MRNHLDRPHVDQLPDGSWEDITTSLDTLNDIICGQTTSFSAFAIFEDLAAAVRQLSF